MTKLKNIFALLIFTVIIYACGDDNFISNPYADVDYEALATSDNDSIRGFLRSHYYNVSLDSIKPLVDGETSLLHDSRLDSIIDIEQNDIKHKLYVFVTNEGGSNPDKGFPTKMDSIFVNRKGVQLISNSIEYDAFDEADETWWSLGTTYGLSGYAPTPIIAWVEGFQKLKSGENITNNGPLTFQNTGKGYFFIPSGLAYPSINYQIGQVANPLFDQILVFKVELLDMVQDTDHDNDGKASIDEDAFSDENNPTLPDYLNANIN